MSEEISLASGNIREIMRLRGLLARAEADIERLNAEREEARALRDEALTMLDEAAQKHLRQEAILAHLRAALSYPAPPPYALVTVEDLRAAELCERAAARLRREIAAPASDAVETVALSAIEAERQAH